MCLTFLYEYFSPESANVHLDLLPVGLQPATHVLRDVVLHCVMVVETIKQSLCKKLMMNVMFLGHASLISYSTGIGMLLNWHGVVCVCIASAPESRVGFSKEEGK